MSNALDDLPHQDSCRFWRHGDICDCGAATPSAPKTAGDTREALAAFDQAVAAELPRVSHVEYDSHEICKHFAGEVRKRLAALTEQPAAPLQAPVEVWRGQRKVTVRPGDAVLRSWGPNIETEMSEAPWSIDAVQEAFDWLYAAPAAPAQEQGVQAELPKYVAQCFGCDGRPSGKNDPCDVCGRSSVMLAVALAAPAQQTDAPIKQAPVLMKLIRAAWKGDPVIAEAYGNLLAERMDADGLTGRYVRDMLAVLRGERQEVLIHPAAASSPAPAQEPQQPAGGISAAREQVLSELHALLRDKPHATALTALIALTPSAPLTKSDIEWAERIATSQHPATREARLRAAMDRMDRDGPLPGMISAFETEFGGDWTDPSWRQETAIWAAAWRRAASSTAPAVQPTEAVAELVEALAEIAWSNDSKWQMDRALAALAKHGQPQGGKEAAQRERMAEKFANRATTQATADFDLPAPNDVVQPQGGGNG